MAASSSCARSTWRLASQIAGPSSTRALPAVAASSSARRCYSASLPRLQASPAPTSSPSASSSTFTDTDLSSEAAAFAGEADPESLPDLEVHPQTHGHHVASLQLQAFQWGVERQNLEMYTEFAIRAAYAFGIPVKRAASLPTRTSLWTVLKGPFVHKKSQENFERKISKRLIKVYDTNEQVVEKWLHFLRIHVMPGVGMRAELFRRRPLGIGQSIFDEAKAAIREGSAAATEQASTVAATEAAPAAAESTADSSSQTEDSSPDASSDKPNQQQQGSQQ